MRSVGSSKAAAGDPQGRQPSPAEAARSTALWVALLEMERKWSS
jgi:hypothetical protein